MTLAKFTATFATVGLLVPVAFRVLWHFIDQSVSLTTSIMVQTIMLVLWPTSLWMLAASPDTAFENELFLYSVISNVVVYALLGLLIWLGLRIHIAFFALAGILLVALWWWSRLLQMLIP